MLLTPIAPRKLPVQDGAKVLPLAERWQRAAMAHGTWAEKAKGNASTSWRVGSGPRSSSPSSAPPAGLAMTFNKTALLVRLVLGYHINNRVDTTYIPGDDGLGTEQVGKALTQVREAGQPKQRRTLRRLRGGVPGWDPWRPGLRHPAELRG